ncbi:MlaA family lipoprotein [Arhodomonas sp. SL1]|uniref:MlaA family lipoprotein n=1 Tax=Arhodomonas sp. SL1 TaxID=3425691 RepID=UPI003F881522
MPRTLPQRLLIAPLLALGVGLGGCATTNGGSVEAEEGEYDPLEPANRKVFDFNESLDEYVLAPAARGWVAVTNETVRTGVGNFFDNLAYPGVILNDLLQGKVGYAADGTARLLVNTTLGVGGLMDPASRMGLAKRNEDFGQTLGHYGAGSGAYLMLPALGPSSARDVTRYPVEYYTGGMNYLALSGVATGGLVALNLVNTRARLEGTVRLRNEAALDPYAFTRSSYLQYRRNLIYDGDPPEEEDPYGDFFDDMDSGGDSDPGAPFPD